MSSRLKTQRRLLAVDFAGTEARIEAATKILARFRELGAVFTHPRVEQVENVKVSAEIELAGVAARQKTLDKIIEDGKQSTKLRPQIRKLKTKKSITDQSNKRISSMLEDYKTYFEVYAPFELKDGKIVVQPIKWTE